MGRCAVRAHVGGLVLCLLAALAGAVLVVAALKAGGAEEGRLLQCFGGDRVDLVVMPNAGRGLGASAVAAIRADPDVDSVREVYGGQLDTTTTPLVVVSMPEDGLPLMPVIQGDLPATSTETVLDQRTALSEDVQVGSTITVTDHAGRQRPLRVSGIVGVDVTRELTTKGSMGLTPQAANDLLGTPTLDGVQVALDHDTPPGPVRDRVADRLGSGYSVFTRQDVTARRGADAQVMTLTLAMLGLTLLFGATAVSCTVYGRLRETCRMPVHRLIRKYGRPTVRKLVAFDRFIGLAITATSGVAMVMGLLVLLAQMGADLPCTSVYSMSATVVVIPMAAYAFALSLAPLPGMLRGR